MKEKDPYKYIDVFAVIILVGIILGAIVII